MMYPIKGLQISSMKKRNFARSVFSWNKKRQIGVIEKRNMQIYSPALLHTSRLPGFNKLFQTALFAQVLEMIILSWPPANALAFILKGLCVHAGVQVIDRPIDMHIQFTNLVFWFKFV